MNRTFRKRRVATLSIAIGLAVLTVPACGSSSHSAGPSNSTAATSSGGSGTTKADKSPITIGYVGEQTGPLGSTFGDGPGAAQARIDVQNAQGGIDGHPLKLVVGDDASTPSQNVLAAQVVASKGAFGVIEIGAFAFTAAPYLKKQGIPVTGAGLDGPEWHQPTYPNMFDFNPPTILNGHQYVANSPFLFFKATGVTKLALMSPQGSPSSAQVTAEDATIAKSLGVDICYQNPSVPFTLANFTPIVLQMKQSGCNGVQFICPDAQAIALSQTLKNAGYSLVTQLTPGKTDQMVVYTSTGYDDAVFGSATNRQIYDGAFSYAQPIPFTPPNAAVQNMLSALHQYDPSYKGTIPDLGIQDAWVSTDMMIQGLKLAGVSLSRSVFMQDLRQVTNYNADGVLPFTTDFSQYASARSLPPSSCLYFEELQGNSFVLYGGKPVCGTYLDAGPAAK